MKKTAAPIKFDSDDTEGSDLSYESSFDEKEDNQGASKEQKNINLFKEQMVRYMLTHPELQDDIKFSKDLVSAQWSSDLPQGKNNQKIETPQLTSPNNAFGNSTQQKQAPKPFFEARQEKNDSEKKNKVYRNPMWESIASSLIQESKRTGAMPSIENFSQRLNLFRKKIEKPDVIEMILTNKEQLLKQIKKEEERKAKIQNRIHETIEAKLRKEQGDVKYYSKLKKNQFDSRMQKEEARVRQNKQTNNNNNNNNNANGNNQQNTNYNNNQQGQQAQSNQLVPSGSNINLNNPQGQFSMKQMNPIHGSTTYLQPRPGSSLQRDSSILGNPMTGKLKRPTTAAMNTPLSNNNTNVRSSILIASQPTQNFINLQNANNMNNSPSQPNQFANSNFNYANQNQMNNSNIGMNGMPASNHVIGSPKGKSLRFQTPEQTGNNTPKWQQRQELENRIMNSNNPVIKDNLALSTRIQIENNKQNRTFKARPVPGVYERLSQDALKKNQAPEVEVEAPLDIDFKTAKGEQLYREISKKEDEEEVKRQVIKFLLEHRQKAEDEFGAKPSLLSQGQKYYSEESKEFSLLSPNFLAKKKMTELINKGILNDDFFEHRANLEEGNVYLLTKVTKILRGNLIRKWKSIQDSKF